MNNNNPSAETADNFFVSSLKFLGSLLLLFVCAIENLAIINEAILFFSDNNSDDMPSVSSSLWAVNIFLAVVNAFPLALAMMDSKAREPSLPPNRQTVSDHEAAKTKNVNAPQSIYLQQIFNFGKFVFIGGPSALLVVSGFFELFDTEINPSHPQLILGSFSGVISAWGYYHLMNTDATAPENCLTLYRHLPEQKRSSVKTLAMGIIFGNFFDNFLGAEVFFTLLTKNNFILKYGATSIITLLSTVFICNTEIRAFLQHEKESAALLNSNIKMRYLLIFPAILSGIFTSVGSAKFIKLIFPELPFFARAIIFSVVNILLVFPNAKGFYYTTLPATDNAIKKAEKYWKKYQCRFFSSTDETTRQLLDHEDSTPPKHKNLMSPDLFHPRDDNIVSKLDDIDITYINPSHNEHMRYS